MKRSVILIFVLLMLLGCNRNEKASPDFSEYKIIDLSHPFDEHTIYWPTAEPFKLEPDFKGITDKGYFYAANRFSAAEHGGTHIDAPEHFAQDKNTVDRIPLTQLMGPAIVIDVTSKAANNVDLQVGIDDFQQWEQANGQIPPGSIVLLKTGHSKKWNDVKAYLGTSEKGPQAVANLHFPGLNPDAARWLVANRQINAIGLDTPSIDYGQSTLFESHRILFEKNIPAFENLDN